MTKSFHVRSLKDGGFIVAVYASSYQLRDPDESYEQDLEGVKEALMDFFTSDGDTDEEPEE